MAFFSSVLSALGAIGKVADLAKYVMQQIKLAGAYVSGWMRSQRVHQEAADDDLQDVQDAVKEAEDESRDDLIDALADDDADGVLDADGVPGDAEAGDNPEHEV